MIENKDKLNDLQQHHLTLIDDINIKASSSNELITHAFFNHITDLMIDNGDLPSATYSPYIKEVSNDETKMKNMKIDGFHYDRDDDFTKNSITLILSDYQNEESYQTFNTNQLEQKFKLAERFIQTCSTEEFLNKVEESSEGFDVVFEMTKQFNYLARINIFLITNSKFNGRLKELKKKTICGKSVSYQLFDLGRYVDFSNSQSGSEPVEINFEEYEDKGLKALQTSLDTSEYVSYLVSVPGSFLAQIYEEFGARLLEQNVRTFLQARGNVNKGIINTIKHKPELFFAYNNGLTATAEEVTLSNGLIRKISNLQIVNGGQTTASLYYAKVKEKADLSKVYVQMKLSVINSDKIAEFVPKISEYANTQNKVNAADFFANHPFHTNLELLAEQAQYPVRETSLYSQKWFYERARGAYKNKTAYAKESERKSFEEKYPKNQVILKTDLAKYILSFECLPHVVSKGAQAAFLEYAKIIGNPDEYNKKKNDFHAEWFKDVISKAIIFKGIDSYIAKADWYEGGGSKAAIITYSIAWFSNLIKNDFASEINFSLIWQSQSFHKSFSDIFELITKKIALFLNEEAPEHLKSITQWAKRKECWERIKLRKIDGIDKNILGNLIISKGESKGIKREAKKIQREYNETLDYVEIVKITQFTWKKIDDFRAKNKINITPKENDALQKRLIGRGIASIPESRYLYTFVARVDENGFDLAENGIRIKP